MIEPKTDMINRPFRNLRDLAAQVVEPSEIQIRKVGSSKGGAFGLRTLPTTAKRIVESPSPQARVKRKAQRSRSTIEGQVQRSRDQAATDHSLQLYLNQALGTPLLTKAEEQALARRIFRFRTAFQRLVLKEPAVVKHLTQTLSQWEAKKLRLDAVCNLALSETSKRKLLEPRIRASLKTMRRLPKRIESATTSAELRRMQRVTVQLVEPLLIRPRVFAEAPFANRKAHRLLAEYQRLCQQMTQANLRLVVQVAKQLCGNSPVLPDMIQEGNRGLMHAVTKFDHQRKIRFSTYATPWIKQAIFAALPNAERNIRVPENFRSLGRKVKRKMKECCEGHSDSAKNISLVSSELGLQPRELTQLLCVQRDTCSLNQPGDGHSEHGANECLGNLIIDRRDTSPPLIAHVRERQSFVRNIMKQALTKREHDVITLRFGIGDGIDRSFAEVGREMGITRERARQVEKRAMEKLERVASRN